MTQAQPRRVEARDAHDLQPLPEMFDESILRDRERPRELTEDDVSPTEYGDLGLSIAHKRAEESLSDYHESLDWLEKRLPGARDKFKRGAREIGSLLDAIEGLQAQDQDELERRQAKARAREASR